MVEHHVQKTHKGLLPNQQQWEGYGPRSYTVFDIDNKRICLLTAQRDDVSPWIRNNYTISTKIDKFETGDVVWDCEGPQKYCWVYDGKEFIYNCARCSDMGSKVMQRLERLEKLETVVTNLQELMTDIRETLGYLPGNSEYECAKERFENRANEKK